MPFVANLNDFAGIRGRRIANVAISVNKGSVKYRVHVLGKGWLPWVTGCDATGMIQNGQDGYAGCLGVPMDRFQLF